MAGLLERELGAAAIIDTEPFENPGGDWVLKGQLPTVFSVITLIVPSFYEANCSYLASLDL